jgi:Fic family protein
MQIKMDLEILKYDLILDFNNFVMIPPLETLKKNERLDIPVDYFKFYNSVSSVYSSKIEGENIDFDSFFKHKFLNVKYKPNYTKKADDLFAAYEFIFKNRLTFQNLQKTHSILSSNLLPKSQQGLIRNNPMFVINSDERIEYVAAEPNIVKAELCKLFNDIEFLLKADLNDFDTFYFASYIHLVFVKIHPFQDGNGRTARLLEKWFLIEKLGERATSVQLEKNYYKNLDSYYKNIKKLGVEYEKLDYSQCLDFLLMTVTGLTNG